MLPAHQHPHGHAVAGDLLRNPDFARFLEQIADGTVTSMQSPAFAGPLVDLMGHTSGHVTLEDLAAYQVTRRAPILVERNGSTISLNAPPAFGGVIVAEALARLDPIDGTPDSWARVLEALLAATESTGSPHWLRTSLR